MPSRLNALAFHLLVSTWLVLWLSSFPLYHFHIPDTTDVWSALHSGGFHTVFTPDLAGEFLPPFKDSQRAHSTHLTKRIVNSPEVGFAVLEDESKTKPLTSLAPAYHLLNAQLLSRLDFAFYEDQKKSQLSQGTAGSRAPPCIFPA